MYTQNIHQNDCIDCFAPCFVLWRLNTKIPFIHVLWDYFVFGTVIRLPQCNNCLFSTVGFTVLVGRHLCNNSYHVILLMMRRKFCFFLKVYRFLRWCDIDSLNGLSISLPRCHVLCYLTVLYTHTCDFSFTYVICMCDFMNALSEMMK